MTTEIENTVIDNNVETSVENRSRSAEIIERVNIVTERVSSRIISKEVNSGTWAESLAKSIKSDDEKTATDSDSSQVRKSRIKSSATYLGAAGVVSGVSTAARYAIGPVGAVIGTLFSATYFARREGRKITEESSKNSSHIQEKYADGKERKLFGAGKRYVDLVEEKVTPLINDFYEGLVARENLPNQTIVIPKIENPANEPEKKVTELTIDSNPEVFSKFVDGLTEDELTDLSRKVLTFVGSATFKDTAQIADMFSNKLVVGNASEEEKQKQQENLEYILKNFESKYPDKFDSTKKETENYGKLTNNEKSKLLKDLRESKFQMVEPKTTEPEKKVTELTIDSNPEVFSKFVDGLTEDELTDLSRKVLTFVGSATFKDTAQIADMFSNKLVVGNASEEEKQKQQENLEYILKNFKSKYPDKFDSTKKETENYRKLTNNEKSKLFKDLRESKFQMVEPKTTEPEKVTELTVDSNPEVFQKYIEVASPKDIIILNNFAKELLSVANRGLSIEGKSKLEHLLSNTLVTDGIELTEDEIRNIVSNIKTLIEYAELHELPETAEEDVSSHSSKESTFLFDAKSAYKAITDIKIPIDTETKETTKAVTNVTDESTSEVTDITDIPKLPDDSNALFIGLVTGYKSNNEEEQKMLDKIKEYIKSKPELLEDENESMRLAIERAMKFTTEARNRIVATQVRRSIFAGLIGVGAGVAIGELVRPLLEHSTKLAIPVHGLRGHNIQKIVTNHGHNANSIHSVSQHVGKNPKLPGVTPNTEKLGNIGSVTLKPGDTVWGILQSKGIQPESQKGLTTIVNMFRNNPHFLESAKIIAKNEGAGKTLSMISNPNVPVSNILKQFTPQQIMHAAHWIPSSGNITL